jgi:hypothetical protein
MSITAGQVLDAYRVIDPRLKHAPINEKGEKAMLTFFGQTAPFNVSAFACGADLSKLIDLAREVDYIFTNIPPYFDSREKVESYQKQLKTLLKERVAAAIQEKQQYYSTTFFGKIKHALLKFIRYCDPSGNAPSIQNARVFLAKV